MKKYLLLLIILFSLIGCSSFEGAAPPEKPEWYTIKSPTGKCYEYTNWAFGYRGYTISGQVDERFCK